MDWDVYWVYVLTPQDVYTPCIQFSKIELLYIHRFPHIYTLEIHVGTAALVMQLLTHYNLVAKSRKDIKQKIVTNSTGTCDIGGGRDGYTVYTHKNLYTKTNMHGIIHSVGSNQM